MRRAKRAAGSRRHLEQVYRDAELGRMAREVLNGLGDLLTRLAALKSAAERAGARHRTGEAGRMNTNEQKERGEHEA